MEKKFVEFEGFIHLMSVQSGGEFSLCGVAFDIGFHDGIELTFKPTQAKTVSCPACIREILNCRGVKIIKDGE